MTEHVSISPCLPDRSPSDDRLGATPVRGSARSDEFSVVVDYVEQREGKHDDWATKHMPTLRNVKTLFGEKDDIGDIGGGWTQFFDAAKVRMHLAKPIHLIRCLDPLEKARQRSKQLCGKVDLTFDRCKQFRHTEWLHTWHLDKYGDFLNWVAAFYDPNYFYVFPVLDYKITSTKSFDVNCNTKYKSRQHKLFNDSTLNELIIKYKCIGVIMNTSGVHWNGALISKDVKNTTHYNIHCYCSMGTYQEILDFVTPWLEAQLPTQTLIFHNAKCPVQTGSDTSSCGARTMLVFQLCMFQNSEPMKTIKYADSMVNQFRYKMLQRLLDHEPT